MDEYCAGKTIEVLAESLFSLKDANGDPLMLALATPKNSIELDFFPTILVEGMRKVLYVHGPNRCINFAQPAVWDSMYAAAEHERVLPCMTVDEQAAFLALLLPKAISRDR